MMENKKNNIEKICGFYVNDWHLAVMLLPYIKNETIKNKKIITFLEENIEQNINTLLSKLNLEEKIKNKIQNIKWASTKAIKYSTIEKELRKYPDDNIILVTGKREHIENINKSIEKYIKNNKIQNIKIINCYEVSGFNKNIREVLDCHDKILNTAGEKQINEVFNNYTKKDCKHAINE